METKLIVEEFLNMNNRSQWSFLFKDELFKCEQDFNKHFFDFNANEMLEYLKSFKLNGKNLIKLSQISTVKSKYNYFFKWSIEHGYTQNNPIYNNRKLLSDKIVFKYINPDKLKLYTPDEIQKMCMILRRGVDGFYLEGILRALYEGVPSVLKFVKLKYKDFDYEKNILKIDEYNLPISNELKNILYVVHERQTIILEGEVRDIKRKLVDFCGSLYKFPLKKDFENVKDPYYAIALGIHRSRFSTMERIIGQEINEEILRNSYYLKHFLDYFNGDMESVKNLITDVDIEEANKHINKAMSNAYCPYDAPEMRRIMLPYFID